MKILIIAPFPTHPATSGPSTRVLNSISILDEVGHSIHYGYIAISDGPTREMQDFWGGKLTVFNYRHPSVHGNSNQRWRARFRKWLPEGNYTWKQNCPIDDWMDHSIKSAYQQLLMGLSPDAVIVNYVWLSKIFDWTPAGIIKILDTHDRFTNRFQVAASAGKLNDWFSTSESEELKGLRRADIVLSINEEDQAFFCNHGLHSIYHPPTTKISALNKPEKPYILFIGNKNAANTQAVEWFIENCWCSVLGSIPAAKLLLIGDVCDCIPAAKNVVKIGRANDLSVHYRKCRCSINPVSSGSGIAIKCLESIGYHRPVIASPMGARGLRFFENHCVFVCQTPTDYADTLVRILQDDTAFVNAINCCEPLMKEWNHMSEQNLTNALNL